MTEIRHSLKKTAEQRAVELVRVVKEASSNTYRATLFGEVSSYTYPSEASAERTAARWRVLLAAALVLHAEEAIRPPLAAGISAERLTEIRRCSKPHGDFEEGEAERDRDDLLTHIDHLSAYLRVIANDDGIEAQDELWRKGFEAGKAACFAAVVQLTDESEARPINQQLIIAEALQMIRNVEILHGTS